MARGLSQWLLLVDKTPNTHKLPSGVQVHVWLVKEQCIMQQITAQFQTRHWQLQPEEMDAGGLFSWNEAVLLLEWVQLCMCVHWLL